METETYYEEESFNFPEERELKEFFEKYCIDDIIELLNEYPDNRILYISFKDITLLSRELGEAIINNYDDTMQILKSAFMELTAIRSDIRNISDDDIELHICDMPGELKRSIRSIRSKDISKLICIEGFVKARAFPKPKIINAAFQCLRCGHITNVEQNSNKFEEPFAGCESDICGKKGPFKLLIEQSEFIDFQNVKIQEFPDSMKGTKPYDMVVQFRDALTGQLEAGDRVSITGILKSRQITIKDGKSCLFEYYIDAVSIEKLDSSFDEYVLTDKDIEEVIGLSQDPDIFNKICRSIAPSIRGHEEVKGALALQLFSGVKKILPDGVILRGVLNIALIGDPSTAKSQMLRHIVSLSPRGVFTSGRSSSAAGLTAAVVKDELDGGGWTLEGGAAVLASGGILGIDEIGHIKEEDKSALHEIMEQGTFTVSKAGIVATLKTECSVLGAGNPKDGYFSKYEPYADQIGIGAALWSRFDLIFTIFDSPDIEQDNAIADHILNNHRIGGMIQNRERALNPAYNAEEFQKGLETIKAPLEAEQLKKYVAYARAYIFPIAPSEVTEAIKSFYTGIRNMKVADTNNKPVPVTVRSLEAIQRLTEASARMRLSNVITLKDVEFAKKLIVKSLRDIAITDDGTLDACLLLGKTSRSQSTKTKGIMGYLREAHTREETLEYMQRTYKTESKEIEGLLDHLIIKGSLLSAPDGKLKSIR